MKVLYFDCSSGISGNMTLGALSELIDDPHYLKNELKKKHISYIEDVLYCVLEKKDLYVIKK